MSRLWRDRAARDQALAAASRPFANDWDHGFAAGVAASVLMTVIGLLMGVI